MITSDDILSLNFYNYGNPFTGSYQGMRYRIIKQKEAKDEEGNILKEEGLLAVIWPEPFAYEKTQDALKKDLRNRFCPLLVYCCLPLLFLFPFEEGLRCRP